MSRPRHAFMGGTQVTSAEKSKRVLDIVHYLSRERQPRTLAEIRAQFSGEFSEHELASHNHVFVKNADTSNPSYAYVPKVVKKYKVRVIDSAGLLALCQQEPTGVWGSDLRDAYTGSAADLDALVADGKLVRMIKEGRKENEEDYEVLYSTDNAFDGAIVDDDIREMWTKVEVPKTLAELESILRSVNQETVSVNYNDSAPTAARKKRQANKTSKLSLRLTNKHKSEDLRRFMNATQNEDD